jgi:acetate CoA/acetoacetate CoA-transferase alpha subunit
LVPQGTLVEQIRAAGMGLGGVLTPTGLGTMVAEGKDVITVDGKEYLLEKPVKADVAILKGTIVDKAGNVYYEGTTKNFQQVMALAADTVIVEAEKLVEVGELDPNMVMTPAILVDYIVVGGDK